MKNLIISIFILLITSLSVYSAERISVIYCINNKHPLYALLSINSILINNKSNSDYTFYIVENDVTERNKRMMKRFVEKRKQEIVFLNADTSNIYKNCDIEKNRPWPKIITARILFSDILPRDVHKVISIDTDTLVISDLKELYDTNIDEFAAGMVKFVYDKDWYNAGVMLINLDFWRRNNLSQKMVDFSNKTSNVRFPDEHIFNYVLKDRIKLLDKKWNNQLIPWMYEEKDPYMYTDLDHGGIIHYLHVTKPWTVFPSSRYYAHKLYYKYWSKSELRYYQLSNFFKIYRKIYDDLCKPRKGKYFIKKII